MKLIFGNYMRILYPYQDLQTIDQLKQRTSGFRCVGRREQTIVDVFLKLKKGSWLSKDYKKVFCKYMGQCPSA